MASWISVARARQLRRSIRAADGRKVSTASTFSTILLREALRTSAQPTRARVLDVGSGPSPYRDLFPADLYVGIDRTEEPGADQPLVVGDAMVLPVASASFDGIVCTETIEHVVDERLLVRELARAGRPGSTLVLSSPFVHGLHEQPYDFRRLTSIGLVSVLRDAGWVVEEMRSVGGPMAVSIDSLVRWFDPLARRAARKLGGASGSPLRAVTRLSSAIQQLLALVTLASPVGRTGTIDPFAPLPRLTLGYVVTAVLEPKGPRATDR